MFHPRLRTACNARAVPGSSRLDQHHATELATEAVQPPGSPAVSVSSRGVPYPLAAGDCGGIIRPARMVEGIGILRSADRECWASDSVVIVIIWRTSVEGQQHPKERQAVLPLFLPNRHMIPCASGGARTGQSGILRTSMTTRNGLGVGRHF